MDKRGLSEVVTTVLIILLVIAAIIIIWVFVRPALSNAGGQLESGVLTSSFSIKPESVLINEITKVVNLTVKRNIGEANVRAIFVILEDKDKNQKAYRFNVTNFNELETRTFGVDYYESSLGFLAKISIAAVVLNKDGQELITPIKDTYIISGREGGVGIIVICNNNGVCEEAGENCSNCVADCFACPLSTFSLTTNAIGSGNITSNPGGIS